MLPWIVVVMLFASVCSAAMGLAWLIGIRRPWLLGLISTACGVAGGALPGAAAGAMVPPAAVWHGALIGGAIGTVVWALLRLACRGPRD